MAESPEPPAQTAPPAPTAPAPSPLDNLVASMGMSQLLIVGGAAVLLLVDLVLGLLLREFFVGNLIWVAALAILLAMLLSRRSPAALPFNYVTVLLIGALVIALAGAREILFSVVSLARAPGAWDALDLVGLVLYSGAVVAVAWGGWMLMRGRTA